MNDVTQALLFLSIQVVLCFVCLCEVGSTEVYKRGFVPLDGWRGGGWTQIRNVAPKKNFPHFILFFRHCFSEVVEQ